MTDAAPRALARLRGAVRRRDAAPGRLDQAVAVARAATPQPSWARIGRLTGQHSQNANYRFTEAIKGLEAPPGVDAAAALAEVGRMVREVERADQGVTAAVAACRAAEVTWQAIADVLGAKQPNVVAKYKPLLVTTVARTVEVVGQPKRHGRLPSRAR